MSGDKCLSFVGVKGQVACSGIGSSGWCESALVCVSGSCFPSH